MKRLTVLTLIATLAVALSGCGAKTAAPATSDDDDDDDGAGDSQPVVSAAASVISGSTPLEVMFTGVAAGGDGSLDYFWDFGDGETAQDKDPTHTFTAAGVFSAVFTATDADGDFAAATVVITVGNSSIPVVSIVANPTTGTAPLDVDFTATASGGNAPLTFAWDFGDGAADATSNPSHTFMAAGTYLARVEVTDADGDVAEASVAIVAGAGSGNNAAEPDFEIFNVGSYESGLEDNYEPNDARGSAYYLGDYGTSGMTYTVSDAYVDAPEVTYYVDVVNYGTDAAAPFYVDFYQDRATAPAANDLGDQYATVATLPELSAKRLYFSVAAPVAGAKAYAFADTFDDVSEDDEANNASLPEPTEVEADEDWFEVYEDAGYSLQLTLDNLPADYDLELYDAAGAKVASSLNASTTAESITYLTPAAGYYTIRVFGYNGATSSATAYQLTVVVP